MVITHYQRLLNYIVPDRVHVLLDGRIVRSGGRELALELEVRLRRVRARSRAGGGLTMATTARRSIARARPIRRCSGPRCRSCPARAMPASGGCAKRLRALHGARAAGTKSEAWKYTPVGRLARAAFVLSPATR